MIASKKYVFQQVQDFKNSFVECEKCGCVLNKATAFKGRPEVRQETRFYFAAFGQGIESDYIYYPYYCKIHKPKVKNEMVK